MICEHPECTGVHDYSRPKSDLCPRAYQRKKALPSQQYDVGYARNWWSSQRRSRYVYAIRLSGILLKIGCSTQAHRSQEGSTRAKAKARGLGAFQESRMIWHAEGDEALEIFLQWCASKFWPARGTKARHSEWFDVTGITEDKIRENLSLWLELSRSLEKQLATGDAA